VPFAFWLTFAETRFNFRNQNGIICSGDFTGLDNDSLNNAAGYLITDVNGNGIVDSGKASGSPLTGD